MDTGKKQYKVIAAVEKKGGGTFWMRVGAGFTNRDNSINLVLDAMPAPSERTYKLQIRELDAEDLRRRESYNSRSNDRGGERGYSNNGFGGATGGSHDAPSDGGGFVRDLGGIGGGPTTRAVTASGGDGTDNIPF